MPATGKSCVITGTNIDRWEGDRIVEGWIVYDLLGALQHTWDAAAGDDELSSDEGPRLMTADHDRRNAMTAEERRQIAHRLQDEMWVIIGTEDATESARKLSILVRLPGVFVAVTAMVLATMVMIMLMGSLPYI